MLIHRNGRFYVGRSSFALPNECKLGRSPYEPAESGIVIRPIDDSCYIDICFEDRTDDAKLSLQGALSEYECGKEVQPIEYPSGTAWCALYSDGHYNFFEVRADAPTGMQANTGRDVNLFRITVTAKADRDIEAIRKLPLITELLNSFQP